MRKFYPYLVFTCKPVPLRLPSTTQTSKPEPNVTAHESAPGKRSPTSPQPASLQPNGTWFHRRYAL